jgi:hypothetical protein
MGPLGAVGVVGGVGGLGQDVEAGEQAEGLIEVEIADVTASLLIEQLQRQQAQQSTGGGYHRRARIAGLVDDLVEAQPSQQGQEQKEAGDAGPEVSSSGEVQLATVGNGRGVRADW